MCCLPCPGYFLSGFLSNYQSFIHMGAPVLCVYQRVSTQVQHWALNHDVLFYYFQLYFPINWIEPLQLG